MPTVKRAKQGMKTIITQAEELVLIFEFCKGIHVFGWGGGDFVSECRSQVEGDGEEKD